LKEPNTNSFFLESTPEFRQRLKLGVYRELHKKELITKEQLDALIALQRQASASTKNTAYEYK